MNQNQQLRYERVAKTLVKDMFRLAAGETVAITVDAGTHPQTADALFREVQACGGIPMLIHVPVARGDAEVGIPDWPAPALTAALCEVDVWIELSSIVMLYSSIWETAMAQNKRLRYLIIGDSSIASLDRVLTGYDVPALGRLLRTVLAMARTTKQIRITSPNGTDVSYLTDPNYPLDIDDGDYSKPIFGTAPGYVNLVPKLGTMNGRIVFDHLMNADVFNADGEVGFVMTNGTITTVFGNEEAEKFKAFLAGFEDPNMYKISHNMIGLNPGVRTLSGEIVEDERIWGGVDFGFGHTSPIDMPPDGQPAKSHFDGVVATATIYFDGVKIIDNGEVCHPQLIELANQLMNPVS